MPARHVFSLLNREVRGLHEAAYILAFFTLGSQVFAVIRDRLLAHTFGTGSTLDAFYAAFRVPDVLYALLASMISVFVLIPFLERAEREGREAVRVLLSELFTFFSLALLVLGVILAVFAPTIVRVLYPGFSEEVHGILVPLLRVLLLQPFFLGVSNLFASYVQMRGRFFLYALAPILYNLGIIFGIVFLYPHMGTTGLGWGVVLGAVLHMGLLVPFIIQEGVTPRIMRPDWTRVREIVKISIPRTIALSTQQFLMLGLIAAASFIAVGSVSSFNLAWNLTAVPLALIGASFSVAAFPKLAKLFEDGAQATYRDLIVLAGKQIVFWALPATALFIVLRAQIVRVVFGSGAFDWDATRLTGALVALLVASLVAQGLVVLLVRACYAAGKTLVPLSIALVSAVVTLGIAAVLLMQYADGSISLDWFEALMRVQGVPGTGVLLVGLAYSIGVSVNALLLLLYFEFTIGGVIAPLLRTGWVSGISALAAGAVAYGSLNILAGVLDTTTVSGVFLQGLCAGLLGLLAWLSALVVLNSADLRSAVAALQKRGAKAALKAAETPMD